MAFNTEVRNPTIRNAQKRFQCSAVPILASAAVQKAAPKNEGWIFALVTSVSTLPAELITSDRAKNASAFDMDMVR